MLPTGRRVELADAAGFQEGRRFRNLQLDDVFTRLTFSQGACQASIHDPTSEHTLVQRWDNAFRECVVFTAPHREAICIEPLTCVPNCMELAGQGIDAGLKILPPGGSFAARVEISVS